MFAKLVIPLFMFTIGVGLVPKETASAAGKSSRVESTNMPKSAPLNLVNRWFARLEIEFDRFSWTTQRLSFHLLKASDGPEKALGKLLLDISGGPQEARVLELVAVAPSESGLRQALENFLNQVGFRGGSDIDAVAAKQAGFEAAIKAALTRSDVRLYSARILEKTGESRVLVLFDDETKDIILLSIDPGPA